MVTLSSQQHKHLSPSLPPYLTNKDPPSPFLGLNLSEPTRIQIRTRTGFSPILTPSNRKFSGDTEIGVFRAERYFNGPIDDDNNNNNDDASSRVSSTTLTSSATRSTFPYKLNELPHGIISSSNNHNNNNNTTLDLEQIRARIQPRTPSSVRSESSWHSRSVLLRNLSSSSRTPRSNRSSTTKIINGKKIFATFGCKCSDKHSVQTNSNSNTNTNTNYNDTTNQKSSSTIISNNSTSTNNNTYYTNNNNININGHRSNKLESVIMDDIIMQKTIPKVDYVPTSFRAVVKAPVLLRSESADVYGSRRLSALWDHSAVGNANSNSNNYDSGSDASSDLFEIDSLTGKTNPFLGRRRSSGDHASVGAAGVECMTPTTGYAPSEASIQWSVVTASAADYAASVVSDFDEAAAARPPTGRRNSVAREAAQRRRAGSALLLGCKSQKATSVAGEAHRTSPGPGQGPGYEPQPVGLRYRSDSPARFQAEIARIGHQMPRLASPSPRSNSHLVYIK